MKSGSGATNSFNCCHGVTIDATYWRYTGVNSLVSVAKPKTFLRDVDNECVYLLSILLKG